MSGVRIPPCAGSNPLDSGKPLNVAQYRGGISPWSAGISPLMKLSISFTAMASQWVVVASFLLCCLAQTCYGGVLFSSLQRTIVVTASPKEGQVLNAGVDKITVTWALNKTEPYGIDSTYKTIKAKLCYAPVSQHDRPWRKTEDNLSRDKTCQHKIVWKPYDASNKTAQSFEWTIGRDIPTATYFIRASLDISSVCFSVFSVVALSVFFYIEKRKGKVASSVEQK